jgi:hypothetical protein
MVQLNQNLPFQEGFIFIHLKAIFSNAFQADLYILHFT